MTIASSPLWPAQLDHLTRASDRPDALVAFYRDAMGLAPTQLSEDLWLLQAPERRLLIARGEKMAQPMSAFRLQSDEQLGALGRYLESRGVECLPNATPLFAHGLSVRDPDGRTVAFGLPDARHAAV